MAESFAAAETNLRNRMAALTDTNADDWFLVAKARQGMQTALEAAREATGRTEVVTQLFTCVTAVDPILIAGLRPCYVDVDPQTLSLSVDALAVGEQTCAVVLQHSYGIVDQPSSVELCDAAHAGGALLVEDSAHCVGRLARNKEGKPVADVSIHSFGVEKILPGTYFGGAVWVNPQSNNDAIAQFIKQALTELPAVGRSLDRASRSYLNQVRVLTRLPQGASQALRARWERKGTFEPAVSEEERSGRTNHEPSKPSAWMCEQALAALGGLEQNEQNRRACVAAYCSELGKSPLAHAQVPAAALAAHDQPLLRFPVFLESEAQARKAARAVGELGFYVPDWPRPLLVPGVLDPVPYGIDRGTDRWPVSERLSAGSVALPTDIDPARVVSVVQALRAL